MKVLPLGVTGAGVFGLICWAGLNVFPAAGVCHAEFSGGTNAAGESYVGGDPYAGGDPNVDGGVGAGLGLILSFRFFRTLDVPFPAGFLSITGSQW